MSICGQRIKNHLQTKHQKVALLLLIGLLVLRIPFLGGVTYFLQDRVDWMDMRSWIGAWFEIGTYLLIACLIWWERKRLPDFHIDRLALIIIILFKPLQTLLLTWQGTRHHPLAFPNPLSITIWAIAIGLVISLWPHRSSLPIFQIKSLKYFGIGILAGIGMVLVLSYPLSLQVDKLPFRPDTAFLVKSLVGAIPLFIYQLGYAAVTEEPLFRGFLWGYLLKAGWKDVWIWLFQALLFSVGHIYYLNKLPISFWLIVPFSSLVLGLLAWRYRSISASFSAHGLLNATGLTVAYIIGTLLK